MPIPVKLTATAIFTHFCFWVENDRCIPGTLICTNASKSAKMVEGGRNWTVHFDKHRNLRTRTSMFVLALLLFLWKERLVKNQLISSLCT
jgi:hypothetical protein